MRMTLICVFVNPWSLSPVFPVLAAGGSVQAGGHMGSALDHADIRGFEPQISVGPEPASQQTRASSLDDLELILPPETVNRCTIARMTEGIGPLRGTFIPIQAGDRDKCTPHGRGIRPPSRCSRQEDAV